MGSLAKEKFATSVLFGINKNGRPRIRSIRPSQCGRQAMRMPQSNKNNPEISRPSRRRLFGIRKTSLHYVRTAATQQAYCTSCNTWSPKPVFYTETAGCGDAWPSGLPLAHSANFGFSGSVHKSPCNCAFAAASSSSPRVRCSLDKTR